jgi:hypothetical protein
VELDRHRARVRVQHRLGHDTQASERPRRPRGDATAAAGEEESVTLSAASLAGASHAAVLYRDAAGNWGRPRGVALPATGDGQQRPRRRESSS